MAESLTQPNAPCVTLMPLARGLLIFVVLFNLFQAQFLSSQTKDSFACAVSHSFTNYASLQKVWNLLSNTDYIQQMITDKTQESCKLAV